VAPTITMNPQSQTAVSGQSVTFSVAATGTVPLEYQWQKDGLDIAGASASTLTIARAESIHAGSYSVLVSNAGGQTRSQAALLTVVPSVQAPLITRQPEARAVVAGERVAFEIVATGTGPLAYAWRKNGQAIPGAVSAEFVIAIVSAADAGDYSVTVSNSGGTITSDIARLSVTTVRVDLRIGSISRSADGVTLAFQATPGKRYVVESSVDLVVWQNAEEIVSHSTTEQYSDANLTDLRRFYRLKEAAPVQPKIPVITLQPQSQDATAGSTVTFSVEATGEGPLHYQWKKNGVDLAGMTDSTLVLIAVKLASSGTYTVMVSNEAGSVESAPASLRVETGE